MPKRYRGLAKIFDEGGREKGIMLDSPPDGSTPCRPRSEVCSGRVRWSEIDTIESMNKPNAGYLEGDWNVFGCRKPVWI